MNYESIDNSKVEWIKWWDAHHFDEATGLSVTQWVMDHASTKCTRFYIIFPVDTKLMNEGKESKWKPWCRSECLTQGEISRDSNPDIIKDMLDSKEYLLKNGWPAWKEGESHFGIYQDSPKIDYEKDLSNTRRVLSIGSVIASHLPLGNGE